MLLFQTSVLPSCSSPFCTTKVDASLSPLSSFNIRNRIFESAHSISHLGLFFQPSINRHQIVKPISCSFSRKSSSKPEPEPSSNRRGRPKGKSKNPVDVVPSNDDKSSDDTIPKIIPRKKRRGRRSEAMAVEDLVRNSLTQAFAAIREQNSDILENQEKIMKDVVPESSDSESSDDDDDEEEDEEEEEEEEDGRGKKMVIEEESKHWPLDADVGWGIRASEYFEQHPIKNVIGEDGVEIDWEGEIDDNWVQEINCLEWEDFAFHPSPLIVLVFERYNRATENWKNLKELEEAIKVYVRAKDRLPPRAVKIDFNIERDTAYALKVRECPQILFLRGNKILYREKGLRSKDELVQMIAFFYYNAKKPAWIDDTALYLRR
ncbi:hypothetical protein Lal_00023828 [Lupinus albus]|uniref:Putative thioredoxin-like protein n=1 Tax=Lupinus albus TaxID=3870 RepID=A0A6A5NV35_LUPAL|nr:putative thioredoxin-like protein [Lupinus albus]KAF1887820.1 hypothetical protein Lal_00023828 [Lupinus albus]